MRKTAFCRALILGLSLGLVSTMTPVAGLGGPEQRTVFAAQTVEENSHLPEPETLMLMGSRVLDHFEFGRGIVWDFDYEGEIGCGVIDRNGQMVVPFVYQDVSVIDDRAAGDGLLYRVEQASGAGVIRENGEVVVPLKYDYTAYGANRAGEFLAIDKEQNRFDFYDRAGKKVRELSLEADDLWMTSGQGLIPVLGENGVGLYDRRWGEELIPCKYEALIYNEWAWDFRTQKEPIPAMLDGAWGYLNMGGEVAIPFQFEAAGNFSDEGRDIRLAPVVSGGKIGFVDLSGTLAIPCQYDLPESTQGWESKRLSDELENYGFYGDLAKVSQNGKWGLIDLQGRQVAAMKYDNLICGNSAGNRWLACRNGHWGMLDQSGQEIPGTFVYGLMPGENISGLEIAGLEKDGHVGFVDWKGKPVTDFVYDEVRNFGYGWLVVCRDEKEGAISSDGKRVIPCIYSEVYPVSSEIISVSRDGKTQYLDKNGALLTEAVYDDAYGYVTLMDGLLPVQRDGLSGFIDCKGREVIPCKYDRAFPFDGGMGTVLENKEDEQFKMLRNPLEGDHEIEVYVDGIWLYMDHSPYIKEGRVMIPIRSVGEALNAEVDWNTAKKEAYIDKGFEKIKIGVGEKSAQIERADRKTTRTVEMDVPAEYMDGRIFVPLRLIGEALGANVDWDQVNKTVSIYY